MKKFFIFSISLFLSNVNSINAQLLNYSNWEMYNTGGALNFYLYLKTDTLSISFDNITYTAKSTYIESANTFQILDLPGQVGNCPDTEIGLYDFSIQNDTLVFTTISDPCISREGTFANNYGVRLLNATHEFENWTEYKLLPKPFSTGIFILSFPGSITSEIKISAFSSDGKKVYEDQRHINSNKEIDLSKNRAGIYCFVMETGNKQIHRKVLLSKL